MKTKVQSWLWPDRTISKRESRQLREEHNALVNQCSELRDTLADTVKLFDHLKEWPKCNARRFFFLRDGSEHGTIEDARGLLARTTYSAVVAYSRPDRSRTRAARRAQFNRVSP